MPIIIIFHERDSLSLDGVGNDQIWFSSMRPRLFECSCDVREDVAVYLLNLPVERLPLVWEWLEVHDSQQGAVQLKLVVVKEDGEIVEFVIACGHGGFPDLALLTFAVSYDGKDPEISLR